MPLKRLNLGSIQFNPGHTSFNVEATGIEPNLPSIRWKDLLAAVPLLEDLNLPRQKISMQDLHAIFTMLPHLRLLALCAIQLDEVLETLALPHIPSITEPITINTGFKIGFKPDGVYVKQLAK
ncbi:hypothetical protein FRC07_005357 [Ceratobasidium sp. 392]|nr:hypothetical protein FRC07_005357 [Ceratobasidium sp. 392]